VVGNLRERGPWTLFCDGIAVAPQGVELNKRRKSFIAIGSVWPQD
jgi:hypothetical protein